MTDRALLGTGIIGTTIVALCCFTPALVILAGVVGAAAIVGYLDYVLLSALIFFVGLTVYAVRSRQSRERAASHSTR